MKKIYPIMTVAFTLATMPSMLKAQQFSQAVARHADKNQIAVETPEHNVKFYDTEALRHLDFTGANVSVVPAEGTASDSFGGIGYGLSFVKSAGKGVSGTFVNADGHVAVTEAKGWQESLYVKWLPMAGADSYHVYVKGGHLKEYTRIDAQLVRDYGAYGRADAVGLSAGDGYEVKVVPVSDKRELTEAATVVTGINIRPYSREGFAHFGYEGVGAYNDDGTLKSNAKVLYVTAATAKTITTEVKTDKNRTATVQGLQAIIDAYQKGNDSIPIAFRFIGKVSLVDLDGISSSAEGLQVKGKRDYSPLNLTFEGIGDDATVFGFGFLVRNARSVEFRNFAIMRCLDDALSLDTKNSHVWIHNMDFFYGRAGGDADQKKGDGTVDIKGDSRYVTVSYNHFWDNGKSSMCGMKGETGENWITYHHNWFDHSDSRHARVRTMSVHSWNNYFQHCDVYGMGATMGSSLFAENNYFEATKRPIMSSGQGTDATGDGTFSGEAGGIIKSFGNVYVDRPANFSLITQKVNARSFDVYETSTVDEQVPSTVVTLKGGTPYNNFDTDPAKMYVHHADDAVRVPSVVTGYYGAGRLNHGDLVFTIPDETKVSGGHQLPCPELASKIDAYQSSLVKIFGEEKIPSGGDTGGDTGGDSGGDTGGEIQGGILCDFSASAPSDASFSVSGNYSGSKGSVTVDGKTLTVCLKMESATKVSFAVAAPMKMTLYFGTSDTKCNVKIDGTKVAGDMTSHTVVQTLQAGSHELTKADQCNLFAIRLEPLQ